MTTIGKFSGVGRTVRNGANTGLGLNVATTLFGGEQQRGLYGSTEGLRVAILGPSPMVSPKETTTLFGLNAAPAAVEQRCI
jgi:hypothetical protein